MPTTLDTLAADQGTPAADGERRAGPGEPAPPRVAVESPVRPRRAVRLGAPHLLVALAVAFNLWTLRAQLVVTPYPNDSAFHLQMVTAATDALRRGVNPLGTWFPNLALGSPLFVQYQSASAILTGAVGLVVGDHAAFGWSLYLLLALWPLCVFASSRLLGWGRWEAAFASAVAPLLVSETSRGFETLAYVWTGPGLWSQLWAMWTLPLALGFTWRYLSQRRFLFGAVAFFSATIALHFLMAYLAAILVLVLALVVPKQLGARLGRAAIVLACSLLATLWVTLPLLADARWTSINELQVHTVTDDSFGAPRILSWFLHGQLFDAGRFPIVTLLVVVGLVACAARARHEPRARALLAIFVASLLLFFGRPTLGAVADHLPLSENLLFQRFLTGVDLAAVLLAGVGAVAVVDAARRAIAHVAPARADAFVADRRWRRVAGLVGVVALVTALTPAWQELQSVGDQNAAWVQFQQAQDAKQLPALDGLVTYADTHGPGRLFAGLEEPTSYGEDFRVGAVPVFNYLESTPADVVAGSLRTFGLMSDPTTQFADTLVGDYEVMGVRFVLTPRGFHPRVGVRVIARRGDYELSQVLETTGLVRVVDTQGSIAANGSDLGAATTAFLDGPGPADGVYPTIAYDGGAAAPDTLAPGAVPRGRAGRVLSEHDDLVDGRAVTTVVARRRAVVVLSAAYDPGWSATVDGRPASTEMVAPALVGVTVGPGTHVVVFTYHGYRHYLLLALVALATLVGVALVPSWWRRRRRGREDAWEGGVEVATP